MADLKKLAEQLVNLTVLEVNELGTILKDEYGIEPAAAAVAVAAPAAGGDTAAAAVRICLRRRHLQHERCDPSPGLSCATPGNGADLQRSGNRPRSHQGGVSRPCEGRAQGRSRAHSRAAFHCLARPTI